MEIVESVETDDGIEIKIEKKRKIVEIGLPIHGFVTVIKNKGRKDEQVLCKDKENLLTIDGRDAFHKALYQDTTATQVGFIFVALSADSGAPSATDTILTAEITTGGLSRKLAGTRTHTDDTNQSTVETVFTATVVIPNVQKSGLFDLVTGGTLSHENTFVIANLEIGDTLTVTWTLTLG